MPPNRLLTPDIFAKLTTLSLRSPRAVVGFDGFVDEMAAVVSHRNGAHDWTPISTIAEFGRLISGAAGRSFGREFVTKTIEAGGNAPNLAEGLTNLGFSVDFFGTLGQPLDAVFNDFARRCRSCTSIGAGCGRTLALEFSDGKLMLNETSRLASLDAAAIQSLIKAGGFPSACRAADLIGLANWSRYPHMTACWRAVRDGVFAHLEQNPWLMLDLADVSGRSASDLDEMLTVVSSFQANCRTVLGLNLNEAGVLLRHLGAPAAANTPPSMTDAATALREHLRIQLVIVHSQQRAAAAWDTLAGAPGWRAGAAAIDSDHTANPVRTTGVGDRFNAGVAAGLVAGLEPPDAVTLGCFAGATFVRRGTSLNLVDQIPQLP